MLRLFPPRGPDVRGSVRIYVQTHTILRSYLRAANGLLLPAPAATQNRKGRRR